jgi:hypothetical protein
LLDIDLSAYGIKLPSYYKVKFKDFIYKGGYRRFLQELKKKNKGHAPRRVLAEGGWMQTAVRLWIEWDESSVQRHRWKADLLREKHQHLLKTFEMVCFAHSQLICFRVGIH